MPASYKVRSDGSLEFRKAKPARLKPIPDVSAAFTAKLGGTASASLAPLGENTTTADKKQSHHGRSGAISAPLLSTSGASEKEARKMRANRRGESEVNRDSAPSRMGEGLLGVETSLDAFVNSSASGGEGQDVHLSLPPSRLKLPSGALLQGRESVLWLEASLQERLTALGKQEDLSRHDYVTRSQEIFNDIAVELTRQITAQCTDRGRLVAKLWVRYTDLINIFSNMFLDERQRHRQEEEKLAAELRKVRVDYVTMVQHTERMLKDQFDRQEKNIALQEEKEKNLCTEIHQLKEELYLAQVALRVRPVVKPRNVGGGDGGDRVDITAQLSAMKQAQANANAATVPGADASVTEEGGAVTEHSAERDSRSASPTGDPFTGGGGGTAAAFGSTASAEDVFGNLSNITSVPGGASPGFGEDTEGGSVLSAELKQQLREMRLTLVDASTELVQHRSQKELLYTRGTMTDPPAAVAERSCSPIPELQHTNSESDLSTTLSRRKSSGGSFHGNASMSLRRGGSPSSAAGGGGGGASSGAPTPTHSGVPNIALTEPRSPKGAKPKS